MAIRHRLARQVTKSQLNNSTAEQLAQLTLWVHNGVLNMSKFKENYFDVNVMGQEIDKTIKPMVVESPWHPGKQITLTGRDARMAGPERVRMSHNKNSTPIGEIYPQLKELMSAGA